MTTTVLPHASSPVLARLCFWVTPERMAEFETAYERQVLPVVRRLGLTAMRARTVADNLFIQQFALNTPAEVWALKQTLRDDPEWQSLMQALSEVFEKVEPQDTTYNWAFHLYTAPAGLCGKGPAENSVIAGPGAGPWHTYDASDGFTQVLVEAILQDRDGYLWFGTSGGAICYDGISFTTLTTEDGLAANWVKTILQDRDGHLWFGTYGGGVSRYDWGGRRSGEPSGVGTFTTLTHEDGLVDGNVLSMLEDREGHLWFGTRRGVSRYDRVGHLSDSQGTFTNFTTQDGLVGIWVYSMCQDRSGNLWFGTWSGLSRYDGETFTTFTTENGLADNWVWSSLQDRDGDLWFTTHLGGVSRYDGKGFSTFGTAEGLADQMVLSSLQDRDGHLWFGTHLGGVSRYDREVSRFGEPSGAGIFTTLKIE